MTKRCKQCRQRVAGVLGHCAKCESKLTPEAKADIENRSKKARGIPLEKTLDNW